MSVGRSVATQAKHAASLTWALPGVNLHKSKRSIVQNTGENPLDAASTTMLSCSHMQPPQAFYFYAFYFYGTVPATPLLALE
jgi:hypothetical protein